MMLDIELGNVMVDGGSLTKFLTSMGKKMLYRIYTFVLVPRLANCMNIRTPLSLRERAVFTFVHIMRTPFVLFDSCSKNRFQSERHEWRGKYVIGTLVIRLAIRFATRTNV